MKKIVKNRGIPLEKVLLEEYRDPRSAKLALKYALESFEQDGHLGLLLQTLRTVAKAQGGLAALARKTDLSRQALHDALSPEGNPRLATFQTVLKSLGFRMALKRVPGIASPLTRVRRTQTTPR